MTDNLKINVIDHPLVQHKLTLLRKKETGTKDFRELLQEVSMLMVYEITRDLPLTDVEIETPVAKCTSQIIGGKKIGLVPILRAGLGMVEGIVKLIPIIKIGHIGLYRDPKTLKPIEYYCKLPNDVDERTIIVADPMLATGGSAAAALSLLKKRGAKHIIFLCLVSAPIGIRLLNKEHPDVKIYTAAVDKGLNKDVYIVPGLGDAGDRLFGTL